MKCYQILFDIHNTQHMQTSDQYSIVHLLCAEFKYSFNLSTSSLEHLTFSKLQFRGGKNVFDYRDKIKM